MMLDEKTLQKSILEKRYQVYYLWSDQSFLLQKYEKKIVKFFLSQWGPTTEVIYIDFEQLDLQYIMDLIVSVGFFSNKKVICVHHFQGKKLNPREKKQLIEVIEHIGEDMLVLIEAADKIKKTDKNTFAKELPSTCGTFLLPSPSKGELNQFVVGVIEKSGSHISKKDAEFLVGLLENNLFLLKNEGEKLALYAQNSGVSREDIQDLVSKNVEQSAFFLLDFILKLDLKSALTLLQELKSQGEEPIKLLGGLTIGFLDMYRYRLMKESGLEEIYLREAFSYKFNDFRVKKASWNYHKINLVSLEKSIQILYGADKKLKQSSMNGMIVLEIALIEIISIYKENR